MIFRCICGAEVEVPGKSPGRYPKKPPKFELPPHPSNETSRTWAHIGGKSRGVDIRPMCRYSGAMVEVVI